MITNEKGKGKPPDVRRLHGKYRWLFRLRVGGFRIIFKMEVEKPVILVIDILPSGGVYKS